MKLVRSRLFVIITLVQIIVLIGLGVRCRAALQVRLVNELPHQRNIVRRLELTDLAIWTEARYTRHPSQADFFAPFQDGPSSLEHFPAGSVVGFPESLRAIAAPGE